MQYRRNGDKQTQTKGGGYDALGALLSPASIQSAIKEFTHPGDSVDELLMRCNFSDIATRNKSILLWHFIRDYQLNDKNGFQHESTFLAWLAASDSINAERMQKLIEALIGKHRGEKGGTIKRPALQRRQEAQEAEEGES